MEPTNETCAAQIRIEKESVPTCTGSEERMEGMKIGADVPMDGYALFPSNMLFNLGSC